MLDLIFVVSDPLSWHKTNIKANKNHYSSLRYFGAGRVAAVQDLAASVYFNPLVTVNGQVCRVVFKWLGNPKLMYGQSVAFEIWRYQRI